MDIAVMNYQRCAANCPPSHRCSGQRAVSTAIEGSYGTSGLACKLP
jgi:hypothetical protein